MSMDKSNPSSRAAPLLGDEGNRASDSPRSILKSTSILSLGTLTSRILGFIRDVILAKIFGTTESADSFFVAFRLSNLWRDLLGEGATNAAVVPVLSEYAGKDPKDNSTLWRLVSIVFVFFAVILSLITLLGIIAAPAIVRLMAPGFTADQDKLMLTVRLTRLLFPYLILIGLTAYSMGILYTLRSFWWPAFSPCLLNGAMIISALLASRTMKEPIVGLAAGVLAGGVLQFAAQITALKKLGMRWVRPERMIHPGCKKIGKLLLPRLLGSGVYQLNIFVDTLCASLATVVGAGGVSAIYYANRIIQFPQGIFGVALASVLLPSLSGFALKGDREALKKTLVFSLKNIFLVMFPVSSICLVLSFPIIRILFERGEFNPYSTGITANALLFYAFGLGGYGGVKIMTTAFYAMQDTLTPVKVGAFCFLINAALNFLLMGPLKVGGIALASSIAVSVNFLILFFLMDRKLAGLREGMLHYVLRLGLASLGMGVVVLWSWTHIGIGNEFFRLLLAGSLGGGTFMGLSFILGIEGVVRITRWVFQKK